MFHGFASLRSFMDALDLLKIDFDSDRGLPHGFAWLPHRQREVSYHLLPESQCTAKRITAFFIYLAKPCLPVMHKAIRRSSQRLTASIQGSAIECFGTADVAPVSPRPQLYSYLRFLWVFSLYVLIFTSSGVSLRYMNACQCKHIHIFRRIMQGTMGMGFSWPSQLAIYCSVLSY